MPLELDNNRTRHHYFIFLTLLFIFFETTNHILAYLHLYLNFYNDSVYDEINKDDNNITIMT